MDADAIWKQLKQQSADLVNREKELQTKLDQIKQLKAQNVKRLANITKLENELGKEVDDL